jgi:hypothetical protein
MSLIGAGNLPDFAEAMASESRGRKLRRLVGWKGKEANRLRKAWPAAVAGGKTRVMMPAGEPESIALDATRVIVYPVQRLLGKAARDRDIGVQASAFSPSERASAAPLAESTRTSQTIGFL